MSARCGWVLLSGLLAVGFQACGNTREYVAAPDAGEGGTVTHGGEAGERNQAGELGAAAGGQGGAAGDASSAGDGGTASGGTASGGVTAQGGITQGGTAQGGATSGGDAAGGDYASSAGAAGETSQLECRALQLACDGECIDPGSALDHCGRCGHSCGPKSECKQGRCQTATLLTSEYALFGLDVSEDGLFFSNGNTLFRCGLDTLCAGGATQVGAYASTRDLRVTRGLGANMLAVYGNIATGPVNNYIYCPISGCSSEPKTFASLDGRGGRLTGLTAVDGDFYFEISEAAGPDEKKLYRVSAKTTPLTAEPLINRLPEDSPILVDDTNVYFARTDENGENPQMVYCARASACTKPQPLLPDVPYAVAAYAGKFFWFYGAPGSISSCDPADCAATTEPVYYIASGVDELVVDADGIFWIGPGNVSACSLPSCTGGPRLLAAVPNGTSHLRAWGGFLYWKVVDSNNASESTLYRVAKP